jgi:hypothetical protein
MYKKVGWGDCMQSQDETSVASYGPDNLCKGSWRKTLWTPLCNVIPSPCGSKLPFLHMSTSILGPHPANRKLIPFFADN